MIRRSAEDSAAGRPNDENRTPSARRIAACWAAIFCAAVLAYSPALHGGFLWDDDGHVCPEPLRSLRGLWRIWTDLGATQQYYPLLHSAFWLEFQLWGESVAGYHWVNILLHAGSACFVVALVRRLALPGAWLAGLIFALHPVAVESVAWISEQKNTLSTILGLASALIYLRFDDDRRPPSYRLAFVLFILALLAKTTTATLPGALLVVIWWRRGRLRWKEDVRPLVPWLVLGAGFGLFTAWVEHTVIGAEGSAFALSPLARGLLAGRIFWFYLGKLVWPADLIFIYPHWTVDPSAAWQWIFPLALIAAALALFALRRICRGPLAAFLIYAGMLFPVLGFFNVYPFVFSYVADHFQYLASIGLIIPAAAGLTRLANRLSVRWLPPVLAAGLLVALGALTWRQTHVYRDAETLYAATLDRNPSCWLAHNNLGVLLARDHPAEAIAHYKAALKLKPDYDKAHCNLANILAKMPGQRAAAIAHYEAALQTDPDYLDARVNFGILLASDPARLPEAIAQFKAAIDLWPAFAPAHANLGTAWSRIPGHLGDAIAQYQAALRLDPHSILTWFDLGNALVKAGRTTEAIAAYESALKIDPDFADAHVNLANVLIKLPDHRADALAHYREALRLRPDWDFVRQILDREATPEQ
ncbi:MAG TPA: tetratricopeptide repeat protein [Opitutaceae bacterium]|nr:tetratricopeptide repeat protein [Opitutaceae bacterium]